MPEASATSSSRSAADVIRRQAPVVAAAVAVAIIAALIAVTLASPTYQASMKLVVGQAGTSSSPPIDSLNLTQTMTQLLRSDVVARGVIDRLNLSTTPQALENKLGVAVQPDSSVLDVTYDDRTASEAQRVLTAYSAVLKREVDQKLGAGRNSSSLVGSTPQPVIFATVFDPPHADPQAVGPHKARTVLVAGVLGLVVGLVLAFVREHFDNRIRSRAEAEEAFGAPVIAGLGPGWQGMPHALTDGGAANDADDADGRTGGALDEAVRALALNLDLLHSSNGNGNGHARAEAPLIAVTSAEQGEGKSSVVANLGVALAEAGNDVICVEADEHEPGLRDYLDVPDLVPSDRGALATASLERLLLDVELGERASGRLRVLLSEAWQEATRARRHWDGGAPILRELLQGTDYVLFDAAPLAHGEASRVASLADDVVIVARVGHTTRPAAEAVRETLERLGVRDVAVVLTDAGRDGA